MCFHSNMWTPSKKKCFCRHCWNVLWGRCSHSRLVDFLVDFCGAPGNRARRGTTGRDAKGFEPRQCVIFIYIVSLARSDGCCCRRSGSRSDVQPTQWWKHANLETAWVKLFRNVVCLWRTWRIWFKGGVPWFLGLMTRRKKLQTDTDSTYK